MSNRKPVPIAGEKAVLLASRRRCCLCVFLDGRDEVRRGQIAHLNHDAGDSKVENLVWLCLEHHDEYDGRTSQSKGFKPGEIRAYRDMLYARYGKAAGPMRSDNGAPMDVTQLEPLPPDSEYDALRERFREKLGFTSTPWRYPLWQVANKPDFFAYKADNGSDGVCLIERVDLPDGRIVIACIETAGNPGCSITNCVEELCFQVCERFEIPAHRLILLEHYDDDAAGEWSWVTFGRMPPDEPFSDPKWTEMTPQLWRQLRLKPRRKLVTWHGHFESKLTKLFHWPTEAL
jgi:hypothetical protein